MSSSNKFVIEKQLVVKEIEVVDLTHFDDESLDESSNNDEEMFEGDKTIKNNEDGSAATILQQGMSESSETIKNNNDGNKSIVLQQMVRWKNVPLPWEIQRMMVSRVQEKFGVEMRGLGFEYGLNDEGDKILREKMSDIYYMLMMVTSRNKPSNAINTYKEHDDFLLCPFCKNNHWKFEGLHDHAKARENDNSLPHKAMRLYLDEVRNYIEIMMAQTNRGEWTSFHSKVSSL